MIKNIAITKKIGNHIPSASINPTMQPNYQGCKNMTTTPELPRTEQLRKWMADHFITDAALAEHLGVSTQATNKFINSETIPIRHHSKCLALGFPEELLPTPFDKPRGPRPKTPIFPGLMAAQAEA